MPRCRAVQWGMEGVDGHWLVQDGKMGVQTDRQWMLMEQQLVLAGSGPIP